MPTDTSRINTKYDYLKQGITTGQQPQESKNYYGRQIEKQKAETKSEVISPPKYQGAKTDPYAVQKQEEPRPTPPQDNSGDDKSHNTDMSNKTNKAVANDYYDGLADRVMDMYDDSASASRPRTGEEELRKVSATVDLGLLVWKEHQAPAQTLDSGRR